MKIGVLGLGYVGIVNVAGYSKAGYTVYCTDVKKQKIDTVKMGKSPIGEPEVDDLLREGIANGNIIPTEDTGELVRNSDILIVCVGTPSKPDGEVNLGYLNNVVAEIAGFMQPEDRKFVAFRSTVPPGTTEEIWDKYFGDRMPGVIPVFYPEFLREGSAVKDFYNYGRMVIGKKSEHNIDELISKIHVNIEKQIFVTDIRTAEYSKYIDNGFHALKVAFANEIFGLASDLDVNVEMAHKIFIADDKLNISSYYFRPGLPFGGSCLPKDVRELQYLMKKSARNFSIMSNVIPSNEAFIQNLLYKIKSANKLNIGFIGFTFKNHSDDLRESPMLKVVQELFAENKFGIKIWDEDMNSEYVKTDFSDLFPSISDFEDCVNGSELLVVSKRFLSRVLSARKNEQTILNFSDEQAVSGIEGLSNLYN